MPHISVIFILLTHLHETYMLYVAVSYFTAYLSFAAPLHYSACYILYSLLQGLWWFIVWPLIMRSLGADWMVTVKDICDCSMCDATRLSLRLAFHIHVSGIRFLTTARACANVYSTLLNDTYDDVGCMHCIWRYMHAFSNQSINYQQST